MFKQTPPDVMHVLLEGVLPLTLQALIKHYIDTTLAKWLLEFLGIPRKILGIPRNLFLGIPRNS